MVAGAAAGGSVVPPLVSWIALNSVPASLGDPVQLDQHRSGLVVDRDGLAQHDQAVVVARELFRASSPCCSGLLLPGDRFLELGDLGVRACSPRRASERGQEPERDQAATTG